MNRCFNVHDIIKGNELDITNADFELQAKRCDNHFTLFMNLKLLIISATRCLIVVGFGSKCIENGQD